MSTVEQCERFFRGVIQWSLVLFLSTLSANSWATEPSGPPAFEEEEVKARLAEMPCLVKPNFDAMVRSYLMGYLVRSRSRTERILGRSVLYFPVFEEYLKQHDLPEGLKFLPVVESALNPLAVSRVGARGLWQFMPETGKGYNLKINRSIDERSDPHKATEAAMKYLGRAHNRFDSWELALASYNAGGGRVSRAVKRARSKRFSRVKRYLPRETRNYVPAFIAASYLMQYYHLHDMKPQYPTLDKQITETLVIFQPLSFYRLSQMTGVDLEVIEALNPAYKSGFIPASSKGNYLILPRRVMLTLKEYMRIDQSDLENRYLAGESLLEFQPSRSVDNPDYYRGVYQVQMNDRLEQIANLFGVSVHHLIAWNDLETGQLEPGQKLYVYQPKEYLGYQLDAMEVVELLPSKEIYPVYIPSSSLTLDFSGTTQQRGKFLYFTPLVAMPLTAVAEQYSETTIGDLMSLNNLSADSWVEAGEEIKIKKGR